MKPSIAQGSLFLDTSRSITGSNDSEKKHTSSRRRGKSSSPQPFTILLLKCIFALLGVFINPKHRKYGYWFCLFHNICSFSPVLVGELYALFTVNTYIEIIDIALFIVSTISINALSCLMYNKANGIVNIYNLLTNDHFIDQTFFDENDAILKLMIQRFGLLVLVCVALLVIYPLIIGVTTEAEIGSLPTLLYPCKYPWSTDTFQSYFITFFMQCLLSIPAFCIITGIILFTVVMNMIVQGVFRVMQNKIRHLDLHCPNCTSLGKRGRFGRTHGNIQEELRNIMKYHQFFNRFVKSIINLIQSYVIIATVQFMVANICVISLVVLVENSYLYRLKIINMIVISGLFFFLCCSFGESLNDLNYLTMTDLYELQWYQQTVPFRKDMVIFMSMLQKPFELWMCNILIIKLALLSSAFKNSYSAIQLVLELFK